MNTESIKLKLKINSMVSKLLTFITGRMNHGIIESTHGSINQATKQARRSNFYKYTRLPTRDPLGHIRSKFWIASK